MGFTGAKRQVGQACPIFHSRILSATTLRRALPYELCSTATVMMIATAGWTLRLVLPLATS
jgi:hypothetical protein